MLDRKFGGEEEEWWRNSKRKHGLEGEYGEEKNKNPNVLAFAP